MQISRKSEINREKDCPFLLKIYWKENDYHRLNLFETQDQELKNSEIQLYTWIDATLKELVDHLKVHINSAQAQNAKFRFSSVYKDPRGSYKRKDLGFFFSNQGTVRNYRKSRDDSMNLQELRFFVGDFMDLTISTQEK